MESTVKIPFLNIKTLGISTGRYVSFLPLPKDEALVSLGSSIALWDMENLTKKRVIQSNRNLITCLLRNKSITVAISYSGEFKVLLNDTLEIIGDYQSLRDGIRHASLGEEYLVINSEKGEELEGIEIWKIDETNKQFKRVGSLKGSFRFSQVTKTEVLFVLERQVVIEATLQENGQPKQKKITKYNMHLYDLTQVTEGDLNPLKQFQLPHQGDIYSSTTDRETICFIYSDRFITVVNMDELHILYEGQVLGMGCFLTAFLTGKKVLHVPAENEILLKIDFSHAFGTQRIEEIPPQIHCSENVDQGKRVVVKNYKSPAIRKRNEVFAIDYGGEKYYSINNECGINTLDIRTNKSSSFKISSVTGCGVTSDPLEKFIAYGDFAGNVFVNTTDSNMDGFPSFHANLVNN